MTALLPSCLTQSLTAKLVLEPDSRVLDIGSGWGGLALYIKEIGGAADVLGVTLSNEKNAHAVPDIVVPLDKLKRSLDGLLAAQAVQHTAN